MRELDTQLRAWSDQAPPVMAEEAIDRLTGPAPLERPDPDQNGRRRAWALLAAAIIVVAAIAAVAFRGAGTDDPTPATPGPDGPQPTAPLPTDPSTPAAPTVTTEPVDPPERPSVLVGYTEDNRLVTLDPDSGEIIRVLAEGFDDPDLQIEGGPFVVADISVDHERGRVIYGTCCEPASGQMFVVDLADGDVETFLYGDRPTLSPDGTKLAYVVLQELKVLDLGTGDERSYPTSAFEGSTESGQGRQVDYVIDEIAWSPDGSQLLLATSEYGEQISEIRLAAFDDGSDLVFASSVLASSPLEGPERVAHPLFHADGSISWVRQGVLDGDHDTAVEERVTPEGDGDIRRTPLGGMVQSRFLDSRGVEWRLSAFGSITEDGEDRVLVPGLRALAG